VTERNVITAGCCAIPSSVIHIYIPHGTHLIVPFVLISLNYGTFHS